MGIGLRGSEPRARAHQARMAERNYWISSAIPRVSSGGRPAIPPSVVALTSLRALDVARLREIAFQKITEGSRERSAGKGELFHVIHVKKGQNTRNLYIDDTYCVIAHPPPAPPSAIGRWTHWVWGIDGAADIGGIDGAAAISC